MKNLHARIAGVNGKRGAGPCQITVGRSHCGLKTCGWPETATALRNIVDAARQMRAGLADPQPPVRTGAVGLKPHECWVGTVSGT